VEEKKMMSIAQIRLQQQVDPSHSQKPRQNCGLVVKGPDVDGLDAVAADPEDKSNNHAHKDGNNDCRLGDVVPAGCGAGPIVRQTARIFNGWLLLFSIHSGLATYPSKIRREFTCASLSNSLRGTCGIHVSWHPGYQLAAVMGVPTKTRERPAD
jgi:hypothetical protein